jgi:hypothetical protein
VWVNVGSLGPLTRPTAQAACSESLICIPKERARRFVHNGRKRTEEKTLKSVK